MNGSEETKRLAALPEADFKEHIRQLEAQLRDAGLPSLTDVIQRLAEEGIYECEACGYVGRKTLDACCSHPVLVRC